MIGVQFVLVLAASLMASGAIAGIIFSRHFVLLMLAVETLLVASTILLISFFSASTRPDSAGIMLLFSIWAIAAAEAMLAITFYLAMRSRGFGFDTSKLDEMKW
ncbi:MAG: hypothetical protein ACP5T3_02210 [Candidatus Micrarchaeia archaeon]